MNDRSSQMLGIIMLLWFFFWGFVIGFLVCKTWFTF